MDFFLVLIVGLGFYSYFIYERSLEWLYSIRFKDKKTSNFASHSFESISVVIAAYNEEKNIEHTLKSILTSIPENVNFKIYVGSDGSTDLTDSIVSNIALQFPENIVLNTFQRIGKGNVLNNLVLKNNLKKSTNLLIFMDANIEMGKNTIYEFINGFNTPEIGIIGATIIPSKQERNTEERYILKENRVKYLEGALFGATIGVFGACFAMRGDLYLEIPKHFITDDLYLTLSIIEKNYKVLTLSQALVYEDITADINNEFERKKRYGAGNFQVLFRFIGLLWVFKSSIGFVYCFMFHKIIRWLMPVLIFIFWIVSFILMNYNPLFLVLNSIGIVVVLYLILNYVLLKNEKRVIIKPLFYFLAMNIAILIGFFKFIKGINTNVWTRSKRN